MDHTNHPNQIFYPDWEFDSNRPHAQGFSTEWSRTEEEREKKRNENIEVSVRNLGGTRSTAMRNEAERKSRNNRSPQEPFSNLPPQSKTKPSSHGFKNSKRSGVKEEEESLVGNHKIVPGPRGHMSVRMVHVSYGAYHPHVPNKNGRAIQDLKAEKQGKGQVCRTDSHGAQIDGFLNELKHIPGVALGQKQDVSSFDPLLENLGIDQSGSALRRIDMKERCTSNGKSFGIHKHFSGRSLTIA